MQSKTKKTINQYYLKQCQWADQGTNKKGNTYAFGTTTKNLTDERYQQMKNLYVWKTISNLKTLDQVVKSRIQNLQRIQNQDYIVSINRSGTKGRTKQVFIVTNHFTYSMNLNYFIKYQKQVNKLPSKITELFHQIAKALSISYKKYGIAHLRLCPSCILIKLSQQKRIGTLMTRLSDFGLGRQTIQHEKYQYFHPQIISQKINPYEVGLQEAFKYDAWSFGIILYQTLYSENILSKMNKNDLTLKKCQQNIKNRLDKNIQNSLKNIVERCLEIKQPFKDWDEIIKAIQENYDVAKTFDQPIKRIFINHVRLMFLFSSIYIISKEKIKQYEDDNSENNLWINENRMKHLSMLLIVFGSKYHQSQFTTHFKSRCHILGPEAILALNDISYFFANEMDYLKISQIRKIIQSQSSTRQIENIFDEPFDKLTISCKMIQLQEKKKDKALKIVCDFWAQLFQCCKQGKEQLHQQGRERYLMIMNQSETLKLLAERQFGFDYQTYLEKFSADN